MDQTIKNLAEYAHNWMRQGRDPQTLWAVLDSRDDGVDMAYRMVQLYAGTEAEVTIPHDTLPIQPGVNPHNGRSVFILSQPNHIPTVQTTMQDALAERRAKELGEEEKDYASNIEHPQLNASKLEEKYLIDTGKSKEDFAVKSPDVVLLDQQQPMWSELQGLGAQFMLTDRVEDRSPPSPKDQHSSKQFEPAE